jgi:thiamine biosynthesis lipoprotein
MREASASFSCFGSTCAVFVMGSGASEAVDTSRARLVAWHERFTRFDARSELSRLNADPRREVRVSSIMALFVHAVGEAARSTGGLVDATLLGELETSGYRTDLVTSVPLASALASAPARRPAAPLATRRWSEVTVDLEWCSVTRPPGLRLDSGGLAKGVLADVLGERLATHASYAVDAAGDLRVGGAGGRARPVQVASPFDGSTLHTLRLAVAGVATSGIGRRSWLNGHGEPAHHLLDPATGRPAYTGVVQATALAPTALEAEIRAKAAVLSGPDGAPRWLRHGGVVVLEDGSQRVIDVPVSDPKEHPCTCSSSPTRPRRATSSTTPSGSSRPLRATRSPSSRPR